MDNGRTAGNVSRIPMTKNLIAKAAISIMFGTNVVSAWKEGSAIVWKGVWQGKSYEDKGVILQPLSLSATIGKEEFFEDEPIYALFQLTNTGSDTDWLGRFELMPGELDVRLIRSDGAVVPRVTVWVDVTDPRSRGDPLAPGGRRFLLLVLQNRYGVEPRPGPRIFDKYLPPGRYTLTATFNPHAISLPVVAMTPLSFAIRPRTPAEDASFGEVARVMGLWWDRAQQGQYVAALDELADRRLKANGGDPYLAYLLNEGEVKAEAAGLRVDSAGDARLATLRVLTALAQRARPSGALAAQAAFFGGAWNMRPTLSERLGSSLAADVVRMHEARDLLYLNALQPAVRPP